MVFINLKPMKSKAFVFFIVSGLIIVGIFIVAIFWDTLGLSKNYMDLSMATMIAFGISITGLILGFSEKRNSLTLKSWIGIVGNLIVIGFFAFIVIYSVAT